jgi:glycosyltransferase involved in cell wall biosynthesis
MTEAPGLVSVIVPFLNPSEQFLREAVESILAQTYSDWEIILIDDGSRECAGLRAARTLADAMSERIRIVTYDEPGNRGASAARNEGLRYASGKYIAFLDADDVWLPGKLQTEVTALRSEPSAGMVYSSYLYWYSWSGYKNDTKRDWLPTLGVESGRLIPPPKFVTLFLQGTVTVPTPSCTIFRRDVLEATGGFETSFRDLYDDQVLFAKVGIRYPVLPLGDLTTRYRQHDLSICAAAGTEAERCARARFLSWLSSSLECSAILDSELHCAVREQVWNLKNPRLARARRWLRKRAGWPLGRVAANKAMKDSGWCSRDGMLVRRSPHGSRNV